MIVLVDTPVWSFAFRNQKRNALHQNLVDELKELIQETRAVMIGPVRQEILSGIPGKRQFDTIKNHLSEFDDLSINQEDYDHAARLFNICRANGIQGSQTDFLICAVAERHTASVFTTDADFQHYTKHFPVHLHYPRNS